MALIGSTIDPRMFVNDYSGYTRAGDIAANSMNNLGGQIASGIDEMKKRQDENAKFASDKKAADMMIKATALKFPDQKEYLDSLTHDLNNPDLSPRDQATMANHASDMISMGIAQNRYQVEQKRNALHDQLARQSSEQNRLMNEQNIAGRSIDLENAKMAQSIDASMGPSKLTGMENMIKGLPKGSPLKDVYSPEVFKDFRDQSPQAQSAFADHIQAMLPKPKEQSFDISTVPTTDAEGNASTQSVILNKNTGFVSPVPFSALNPGLPSGDGSISTSGVLPPKNPQNETPGIVVLGQDEPVPAFDKNYVAPKSITSGASKLSKVEMDQKKATLLETQGKIAAQNADVQAKAADFAKTKFDQDQLDQGVHDNITKSLAILDSLDKHPGFNGAFGTLRSSWVPGSEAANAGALYDQIHGLMVGKALSSAKAHGGLGQRFTEKEILPLAKAESALSPNQSEAESHKSIALLKQEYQAQLNRMNARGFVPESTNPDSVSPTTSSQRGNSLFGKYK